MHDPELEPPSPIALLIADVVYQERTGKYIICGTFNSIYGFQLPIIHDRATIYFALTNISKPVDLVLRIEFAADGDPILEMKGPISAKSPLEVVHKTIQIHRLKLQRAGKYWIQLTSRGEILIQAPLYANIIEKPVSEPRNEPSSPQSGC